MAQDSDVTPSAEAAASAATTTTDAVETKELPIRQNSFGTAAPGQTLTGKQEHCALCLPRA